MCLSKRETSTIPSQPSFPGRWNWKPLLLGAVLALVMNLAWLVGVMVCLSIEPSKTLSVVICPIVQRECRYCVAQTGHVCSAPIPAMLHLDDGGEVGCTQEEA